MILLCIFHIEVILAYFCFKNIITFDGFSHERAEVTDVASKTMFDIYLL